MNSAAVILLLCFLALSNAFLKAPGVTTRRIQLQGLRMAIEEVQNAASLDDYVSKAGDKVIIVDYSTTWCGPCKMVYPKYVELSEKYPTNAIFLKCIGDTSAEAGQLMKREGVRSVPAFHIWKNGAKVDTINGARIDDVEAAILSHSK